MAYTEVDYGTQTPQTIDRFGTEQDYAVRGRNGNRKVRHLVTPVRTAEEPATKAPRRFWWTFNRYTGFRSYNISTVDKRSIQVHVDADGAMTIRLDGRVIHEEPHVRRPRN